MVQEAIDVTIFRIWYKRSTAIASFSSILPILNLSVHPWVTG